MNGSSILAYSWSVEFHAHKVRSKALLLDCMTGHKNVFYKTEMNHLNFKFKSYFYKNLVVVKHTDFGVHLYLQSVIY